MSVQLAPATFETRTEAPAQVAAPSSTLRPIGPTRIVERPRWHAVSREDVHLAPVRARDDARLAPVRVRDGATVAVAALTHDPARYRTRRVTLLLLAAVLLATLLTSLTAATANAATALPGTASPAATHSITAAAHTAHLAAALPATIDPTRPDNPDAPTSPLEVTVDAGPVEPSTSIVVLVGMTVLAVAPSLLLMTTSFLKILVVLSLTRNALGLQGVPPNQVLAGIALFLSLFIMTPVVDQLRDIAIDPYLAGEFDLLGGLDAAIAPMREFMVSHTREEDIALLTRAAELPNPATPADVPITTLIPAFMLSELRAAFVIGFVIFIPFLVIDLVVGAILMSMGMMMLPPVMISLPFKILLMVLVDGWGLIVTTLVGSY